MTSTFGNTGGNRKKPADGRMHLTGQQHLKWKCTEKLKYTVFINVERINSLQFFLLKPSQKGKFSCGLFINPFPRNKPVFPKNKSSGTWRSVDGCVVVVVPLRLHGAPVLRRKSPWFPRIVRRSSSAAGVAKRRHRNSSAGCLRRNFANATGWKHDGQLNSMLHVLESWFELKSGAEGWFHLPHALESAPEDTLDSPRPSCLKVICARPEANSMPLGL